MSKGIFSSELDPEYFLDRSGNRDAPKNLLGIVAAEEGFTKEVPDSHFLGAFMVDPGRKVDLNLVLAEFLERVQNASFIPLAYIQKVVPSNAESAVLKELNRREYYTTLDPQVLRGVFKDRVANLLYGVAHCLPIKKEMEIGYRYRDEESEEEKEDYLGRAGRETIRAFGGMKVEEANRIAGTIADDLMARSTLSLTSLRSDLAGKVVEKSNGYRPVEKEWTSERGLVRAGIIPRSRVELYSTLNVVDLIEMVRRKLPEWVNGIIFSMEEGARGRALDRLEAFKK